MTIRKIFTSPLALAGLSLATLAGAQTDKPATEPAKVGPFEVAPHWSRYDYPKSIKEGQAYHIVVKGDTLWDISGRYLGNPYLWPQIWEANGYVKKARLIYPGDPIFLPSVQMAAAAAPAADAGQPGSTASRGTKIVDALGTPEWMDMDAMINVASADTVRYAGYISASIEDESLKVKGMEAEGGTPIERVSGATRDYLYLDRGASSGLKAGDVYSVHRRAREIKHPVTGKKVGYRIDTTGVARIVLVGERSARAVVESSGREVKVGDYLRPLTEVESPLVKRRVVVDGGDLSMEGSRSTGYVVDIDDDGITSANGLSVGVDVGSGAGLSVGRVITLFRQGDKHDPVTKRALGAAVVLAVRENFSVARMIYTREEVIVGDRVIVQP
jgi:LysM repeat protein